MCTTIQLFSHILYHRYDWWLPQGLAGYVAGLCMSKMFGSTWYQHYIKQVSHQLCYSRSRISLLLHESDAKPRTSINNKDILWLLWNNWLISQWSHTSKDFMYNNLVIAQATTNLLYSKILWCMASLGNKSEICPRCWSEQYVDP